MGSAQHFTSSPAAILAAVTARRNSNMESDSICWQQIAVICSTVLFSWLLSSICMVADHINNFLQGYMQKSAVYIGVALLWSSTRCIVLKCVSRKCGRKGSLVIGMCLAMFLVHRNEHKHLTVWRIAINHFPSCALGPTGVQTECGLCQEETQLLRSALKKTTSVECITLIRQKMPSDIGHQKRSSP